LYTSAQILEIINMNEIFKALTMNHAPACYADQR